MPIVESRVNTVSRALVRSTGALAAVLRHITDPTPTAVGTWTIGETANHVAGSHGYFLAAAQGGAAIESLNDVDAGNARRLAADPVRDPSVLADRLEAGVTKLVDYASTVRGNPVLEPFTGVRVPLSTVLAIELAEVLVHGHDIASAAGLPWQIEPSEALVAHRELLAILPYLLDERRAADARVEAEIRIRGMEPVVVTIHDGVLEIERPAGQKVDFRMSVDPAAYLLMSFNRVHPMSQVLRGKLLVWGRRPWKIQAFQSMITT